MAIRQEKANALKSRQVRQVQAKRVLASTSVQLKNEQEDPELEVSTSGVVNNMDKPRLYRPDEFPDFHSTHSKIEGGPSQKADSPLKIEKPNIKATIASRSLQKMLRASTPEITTVQLPNDECPVGDYLNVEGGEEQEVVAGDELDPIEDAALTVPNAPALGLEVPEEPEVKEILSADELEDLDEDPMSEGVEEGDEEFEDEEDGDLDGDTQDLDDLDEEQIEASEDDGEEEEEDDGDAGDATGLDDSDIDDDDMTMDEAREIVDPDGAEDPLSADDSDEVEVGTDTTQGEGMVDTDDAWDEEEPVDEDQDMDGLNGLGDLDDEEVDEGDGEELPEVDATDELDELEEEGSPIDSIKGEDILNIVDVDDLPDAEGADDLLFASNGNTALVLSGTRVIAQMGKARAIKAGVEDIYHDDKFHDAVIAECATKGIRKGLTTMGYALSTVKIGQNHLMAKRIEARTQQVTAKMKRTQEVKAKTFDQALAIAAVGINRRFFKGQQNALQASLGQVLAQAGVRNADRLVNYVFNTQGVEYAKQLVVLARQINNLPADGRNSLAAALDMVDDEGNFQEPEMDFNEMEDEGHQVESFTEEGDGLEDFEDPMVASTSVTAALLRPGQKVTNRSTAGKSNGKVSVTAAALLNSNTPLKFSF